MDDIDAYLAAHTSTFEDDLCALLRIPGIGADTDRHPDVRRAADWVAGRFRAMGLPTELIETSGQPLVYAETPKVPGQPTIQPAPRLGHYRMYN